MQGKQPVAKIVGLGSATRSPTLAARVRNNQLLSVLRWEFLLSLSVVSSVCSYVCFLQSFHLNRKMDLSERRKIQYKVNESTNEPAVYGRYAHSNYMC